MAASKDRRQVYGCSSHSNCTDTPAGSQYLYCGRTCYSMTSNRNGRFLGTNCTGPGRCMDDICDCVETDNAIDGTCPSVCPPPPPPIPPIRRPAGWNATACRTQCVCTGGELPADRAACQACSTSAPNAREPCCADACERSVYLRLVFNGEFNPNATTNTGCRGLVDGVWRSVYTSACRWSQTMGSNVRSFVQQKYYPALRGRVSRSYITNVTLYPGTIQPSIIALVEVDLTAVGMDMSNLTVLAEYLVTQNNVGMLPSGYNCTGRGCRTATPNPQTMRNGMTMTMVSIVTSNSPDPVSPSNTLGSGSASGDGDDDGAGMSGGAIAGLVIGVLALLGLIAVAAWFFLLRPKTKTADTCVVTIGRALSRFSNPAAVLKYAGAVLLAFVLLLAIIGTALPSMVVYTGDAASGPFGGASVPFWGMGAWTWELRLGSALGTISMDGDSCDYTFFTLGREVSDATQATDCFIGLESRCQAGKAFSILGIFSNAAAVAVAVLPTAGVLSIPYAQSIALATAGFTAFSYMIVFSVWAATFNGEAIGRTTTDDSNCGFNSGDINGQTFSLGPAHGLFVSAFFFSLIAIGLYVAGFILAPKYGWVGNNPYGAGGGSSDDEARCRSCRSKLAVCVCKDKEARRTSVMTSKTNSAFIPNVESEGC